MAFEFIKDCKKEDIDSFVVNSKQNSLNQETIWADVKNNWGHVFTCVKEDGKTVASAVVLFRDVPFSKTLAYVPKGPVMDYENQELVKFMMDNLVALAKEHKAIALRFDPVVLSRKYFYKDRNNEMERNNENVIHYLESLGARHGGYTIHIEESTQPRFNAMMDVDDNWQDHLEHKTAKCIRSAKHKGIEILEGKEYIKELIQALHHTESRKGIILRNEEYFENMMDLYKDRAICMVAVLDFDKQIQKMKDSIQETNDKLKGECTKKEKNLLLQMLKNDEKELERLQEDKKQESENRIVTCGIFAVYNDNLMELLYMGNHPKYMRMYSSYLLYATCIERCKELHIPHCSFGGIEGTLDDGLTLFKSNWPMQVEEYIGEFNVVLDKLVYWLFDKVYPVVRNIIIKIKSKN